MLSIAAQLGGRFIKNSPPASSLFDPATTTSEGRREGHSSCRESLYIESMIINYIDILSLFDDPSTALSHH